MNAHLTKQFPFSALGLTVFPGILGAQVAVPGFTGFQRLTLPGNSDSYISTPFARSAVTTGLVQSLAGNAVTVKGAASWQPGAFVDTGNPQGQSYYLIVVSGAGAGSAWPITGNTANTLTVDLDGDTINAAANDRLAVVPYWTLGSLFPGGAGVHVSPSSGELRTEIIIPDPNATTLSGGTPRVFYCLNGDWMEKGQPPVAKNSAPLSPDSFFIVRHNIATSTELLANGSIVSSRLRSALGVNPTSKRDNFLGLQRPTSFTLAGSGLIASGVFAASPTPSNRTDELYVYDNSVIRQNKSASAVYFYWNNGWRKVGAGTALFDNTVIFTPGTGFIIRKNTGSVAPFWLNTPNY
jgi:uncharacterized protein (TIGR02597 family)